jgi:hypothetical protein
MKKRVLSTVLISLVPMIILHSAFLPNASAQSSPFGSQSPGSQSRNFPSPQFSDQSPFFPRHEIENPAPNDDRWTYEIRINNSHTSAVPIARSCLIQLKGSDMNDVESVSYYSDGKTLDSTFWLSAPFRERPIGHNPVYGMLISVDPIEPSLQGYYNYYIYFDGKSWIQVIKETPKNYDHYSNVSRTLFVQPINYSTYYLDNNRYYFEENNRYLHLPLDLSFLNFPREYVIRFYTSDLNLTATDNAEMGTKTATSKCPKDYRNVVAFSDYFDSIRIPSAQFDMSLSPNYIQLRPGEEKTILLKLNSTAFSSAHVNFFRDQVTPDVTLDFLPSSVELPANGVSTSLLSIKAMGNAKIVPYSIPISANVSVPILNSTLSQHSSESSDFRITNTFLNVIMQKPLTIEEKWTNFWNVYGGLISFVGAGFAAGFATMVFSRLQKKSESKSGSPL